MMNTPWKLSDIVDTLCLGNIFRCLLLTSGEGQMSVPKIQTKLKTCARQTFRIILFFILLFDECSV